MFALATNCHIFYKCFVLFKLPFSILFNVLVNYNNPVSNKSVVYTCIIYFILPKKSIIFDENVNTFVAY